MLRFNGGLSRLRKLSGLHEYLYLSQEENLFHSQGQYLYPSTRKAQQGSSMKPGRASFALFLCSISRRKYLALAFRGGTTFSSSRTLRRMTSSTTIMPPTIGEFLEQSSSRKWLDFPPRLVLGNPAGDADSIISAIGIAYLDTVLRKRPTLPLVSIPLDDLKSLRPETKYLLTLAGISNLSQSFVTIDDDLPDVACVTLVDHNQILEKFNGWKVDGILDHHIDEKAHTDTCPICETSEDRTIAFDHSSSTALVASTCTLVVERWQKYSQIKSNAPMPIPPTLSILLLGVILLDSINLSPTAGKATQRDLRAVETLQRETDWNELNLPSEICAGDASAAPDLTLLFDTLQNQKFKPEFWDGLTASQALKLDYKAFTVGNENIPNRTATFGISSVLQNMTDFLEKPNIWRTITDQYLPTVQFFGIMFMTVIDDAPMRQIILTSLDDALVKSIVQFLEKDGSLRVQVVENIKDTDTGLSIIKMNQGNSKGSRKQVVPIFMDFYATNF